MCWLTAVCGPSLTHCRPNLAKLFHLHTVCICFIATRVTWVVAIEIDPHPFHVALMCFMHRSSFKSQKTSFHTLCCSSFPILFSPFFLTLFSLPPIWIWLELFQQLHFPSNSHLLFRPNLSIFLLHSLYSVFFSLIPWLHIQSQKLELQVANWHIYLIYVYYLYSQIQGTKVLWEISSATLKVHERNWVRFPERFTAIIMITWE